MRALPFLSSLLLFGLTSVALSAQTSASLPYQNPKLPIRQRVDDLVSRMTLDEKVPQLINTAPAIPRLNVPAYDFWSEGLHGVARSGYATLFPQAIGMAATWDAPLLKDISTVISTEARAKYNEAIRHDVHSIYFGLTIWSPNINIFRDPRWGRGQETYGEDPFLTSRLGVNFVEGLQGTDPNYYRVIATPKHFAVHSGPESDRHRFNVKPSPHDLWDTYLPAFRATIVEGKADSIMCAYNAIDGAPACASKELLEDILRKDWAFKGFVTSDCGAVDDFFEPNAHRYSTSAETASVAGIRTGTDTNCGDTYLALNKAVQQGLIKESEIDVSLKRLFTARFKLGLFDPPATMPYSSVPFSEVASPEHHALALKTARESMVLLKNDSILPLKPGVRTVAVIGPNAAALSALEGNYNAVARDPQMPLDALTAEFKSSHILYAQGAPYADGVALPAPRSLFHPSLNSDVAGLKAEYFAGAGFTGQPILTRVDPQIDFDWNSASPVPGAPADQFSVRWSGTITPPAAGTYHFSMRLAHCYPCGDSEKFTVYLDGRPVTRFAPAAADSRDSGTPPFTMSFADTKPHQFRVEYQHQAPLFGGGISMEWSPGPHILEAEAVAAAQKSDVVVAFLGLSPELEGEEMPIHVEGFAGGDRTDIRLPASQQHMLEAVAATGKPIVVVLLNGSALSVTWAQDHANAILEAWYPGEAGAQAIAETLSGHNNPGGRLPVTFYASVDQLPAFTEYGMANRTYRYFKGKPLYGFGYGLSYSTFTYPTVKLSTSTLKAGDTLVVEANIKNTSTRAGDEVAELYLAPPQTDVSPTRALAGFERVHLAPGETKHLTFHLDPRTLSQVDDKGIRAVTPGQYTVTVSGSQPTSSTPAQHFTIEGSQLLPN